MIRILCVSLFFFMISCDNVDSDSKEPSQPQDAQDPSGNTPLAELSDQPISELELTLEKTRYEINLARPEGMKMFLSALKKRLEGVKFENTPIDATVLDSIDDATFGTSTSPAAPMPGKPQAKEEGVRTGMSSRSFALSQVSDEVKACPILADEQNEDTDCMKLVESMIVEVKDDTEQLIEQNKQTFEEGLQKQYADLPEISQKFISSWALTAKLYGVNVTAVYAKYELAAELMCDDKSNAMVLAESVGEEEGWEIVETYREWAVQQVQTCSVNTDLTAEKVRQMSKKYVEEFVTENKLCQDEDLSATNAALKEAELKREKGLYEGIDNRVEVLRNELFQIEQTNCTGGGGEPLVIDLDGDGLDLTTDRVSFDLLADGTKQSVTWVGRKEGLVAIDLDGDGSITSVAELMGNKSDCGGKLCYDGIDALAAYDKKDRGGNADGQIDERDLVFQRLLVWVDANHDGVSQTEELTTFVDAGITAIRIKEPDYFIRKTEGATISAEIQVLTKAGFRTAYDVWFQMKANVQNLMALWSPSK